MTSLEAIETIHQIALTFLAVDPNSERDEDLFAEGEALISALCRYIADAERHRLWREYYERQYEDLRATLTRKQEAA